MNTVKLAALSGMSLNQFVQKAIQNEVVRAEVK